MNTRTKYWACQILGWGGYTALGVWSAVQQVGWRLPTVAGYMLFFFYSIALTDLLRREIRRRGWLDHGRDKPYPRLFLAAVLLSGIQAFLVVAFDLAFLGKVSDFSAHPEYAFFMWAGICSADCIWLLFYVGLTTKRHYREKEVRLQLVVRDAELRALEAQVNPHFLFNCLNSIRAMVVENPVVAQDMITRFATILRYNLQRDLKHTVPLESEVEVVTDYLALESIRFEDRLRVELGIDQAAGKVAVPPMLLQTLVENGLKHGIAHLPAGGHLRIRARVEHSFLVLEVENTGQLTEPRPGGTHMGLANARERLHILYGSQAGIELSNGDGAVVARVRIPTSL